MKKEGNTTVSVDEILVVSTGPLFYLIHTATSFHSNNYRELKALQFFQKNYTILFARLLVVAFAVLLAALQRSSLYEAVRRKESRPFSMSTSIQPVSGSALVCWQIAG